jgi:hypothetical protein
MGISTAGLGAIGTHSNPDTFRRDSYPSSAPWTHKKGATQWGGQTPDSGGEQWQWVSPGTVNDGGTNRNTWRSWKIYLRGMGTNKTSGYSALYTFILFGVVVAAVAAQVDIGVRPRQCSSLVRLAAQYLVDMPAGGWRSDDHTDPLEEVAVFHKKRMTGSGSFDSLLC